METLQYDFKITADTTIEDLKRQKKQFMLSVHPDKEGGNHEATIQLEKEYELYVKNLSDIKDWDEMAAHTRISVEKIGGFALRIISQYIGMPFIYDMGIGLLKSKMPWNKFSKLRMTYITYLFSLN